MPGLAKIAAASAARSTTPSARSSAPAPTASWRGAGTLKEGGRRRKEGHRRFRRRRRRRRRGVIHKNHDGSCVA
eukprot:354582-Pyramimonas_sp.AAC.1